MWNDQQQRTGSFHAHQLLLACRVGCWATQSGFPKNALGVLVSMATSKSGIFTHHQLKNHFHLTQQSKTATRSDIRAISWPTLRYCSGIPREELGEPTRKLTGQSVPQPRFEPSTSQLYVRIVTIQQTPLVLMDP
jgi:hypothetical protein